MPGKRRAEGAVCLVVTVQIELASMYGEGPVVEQEGTYSSFLRAPAQTRGLDRI